MKPTPPGWPRISVAIYYEDAARAIDWLCRAFGFETRLKIEGDNGVIEHSELTFGDGLIMIGQADVPHKPQHRKSPRQIGGTNTQNVMVYVDDAEAHCAHARTAGATIVAEPSIHDYGEDYWADRGYECVDLEGHHWWFFQRLRTGKA